MGARRTRQALVLLALLFAAALSLAFGQARSSARLLHTEPSEFAPVVVFEQYGERCLNFVAIERPGRQSCYQLDDPDKLVFEYTRMMASALLVKPDPGSVLIVGLGGASLPKALHKILPHAMIDSVEIDPAVVTVAQRYFGYRTGSRQRVFIEDGREFIKRAAHAGQHYDMIMLDAFDTDYIPAHLMTVEFLQDVRNVLAPDGIVVANSFARSALYQRESASYADVFGTFYNLRAHLDGNRVIIAAKGTLPPKRQLQRNARTLATTLKPFGIDTKSALSRFKPADRPADTVEPLRDPE